MWTVRSEPAENPDSIALLREYFRELTVRYFDRPASEEEVDWCLVEWPSTGLAAFLVLRGGGAPAGCMGVWPTGELTKVYVAPRFRRGGGARALLSAAEAYAREQGLPRLFLDTRTDLVEARAFYLANGFVEIPPPTATPARFQDHWYEKVLSPGLG